MDIVGEQLLKRYFATEDPEYAIRYVHHIGRTKKLSKQEYLDAPIGLDNLFELLSLESRTEDGAIYFPVKLILNIHNFMNRLLNEDSTGVILIWHNTFLDDLADFNIEKIKVVGCEDYLLYLDMELSLRTNERRLNYTRSLINNYYEFETSQPARREYQHFLDILNAWEGIVLPLLED